MVGHKVALITDSHFGARKGSQILHDYFEKFYKETFFPELDKRGIKTVIHLGDCFDVRKSIDYWSLDWSRRVFFDELLKRDIRVEMIVGNHDCFYKNKLDVNAPRLNLSHYPNVRVWDNFGDIEDLGIFMCPWICEGNIDDFGKALDKSTSPVCMGHLELSGFPAYKGYIVDHGMDPNVFWKFDKVFSGHFHTRSQDKNVTYLGNPYQMYWNDDGDTRGFHIFDTKTQELEFIQNPNDLFLKVNFCQDDLLTVDCSNKYVKVVIDTKTPPATIAYHVDRFYDQKPHEIKIIENYHLEVEEDVEVEVEDTLTTLSNYVMEIKEDINKDNVIGIFTELYKESQEV